MQSIELAPLPPNFTGTIITDCGDDNARMRQTNRFVRNFGFPPSFVQLTAKNKCAEAALNLVDALDSSQPVINGQEREDLQGVVLVNVAPRGSKEKEKWPNGVPFCHFTAGNVAVVSTLAEETLSLVEDLGLMESDIKILDVPVVADDLAERGIITERVRRKMTETQFRSYEFSIPIARLVVAGIALASTPVDLPEKASSGDVLYVDCFGNVKTRRVVPQKTVGGITALNDGRLPYVYRHLADVPTGELAVTAGSSGFGSEKHGEIRLLEVVVSGGSAAEELGVSAGSRVFAKE